MHEKLDLNHFHQHTNEVLINLQSFHFLEVYPRRKRLILAVLIRAVTLLPSVIVASPTRL